jgi:hypothetical protein
METKFLTIRFSTTINVGFSLTVPVNITSSETTMSQKMFNMEYISTITVIIRLLQITNCTTMKTQDWS